MHFPFNFSSQRKYQNEKLLIVFHLNICIFIYILDKMRFFKDTFIIKTLKFSKNATLS